MTEMASASRAESTSKPINLKRMFTVWLLLALAMTAVSLACLAALPKSPPPADPQGAVPRDTAALGAMIWPEHAPPGHTWRYIVVHHSATPSGTLEAIDQNHRDRGFVNGAGYHFLINNGRSPGTIDGQITPTGRWLEQIDGAHTKVREHPELNAEGIGICLVGNFEQSPPTPAQMASLEVLVLTLRDRYNIPLERIIAHGELKNTQCPGRLFPMEAFLMDLRQAYLKSHLATSPSTAE